MAPHILPLVPSISEARSIVRDMLAVANIELNGSRPWDMNIHDDTVPQRILAGGSLALGETYMEGLWDTQDLSDFFFRLLRAHLQENIPLSAHILLALSATKLMNLQTKTRSRVVAKHHYDMGNDLYTGMLDKRMIYSCGYWKDAQTLPAAQEAKLDLICRKLRLQKGMRLLDIGCGWGGLAQYAAQHYGAEVTGITISQNQAEYAQKLCAGLPVKILLQDYRDVTDTFDRIVSVGMMEHVGYKNYGTYMSVVHRCLVEGGITLLHTIGTNRSSGYNDPWIAKYIFPHSMLPSLKQITEAAEPYFVTEDLHSFGQYYDKTLLAWYENFEQYRQKFPSKYDDRFVRMWHYYLLSCAGSFRARNIQLWQFVFSKDGIVGGYDPLLR